jgi:hypothetical protein
MAENREKQNIFVTILPYLLLIGLGLFLASIITFFALWIADAVFYPKTSPGLYSRPRGYFSERINWTFAAIVFVISFITAEISIFRKDSKRMKRDEDLLTELNLNAAKVGKNPKAFTDGDSFGTEFSIDETRFNGRFNVLRLPRKGTDERIGVASVSFKVTGCEEDFYIQQKDEFLKSGLELLSILPPSKNNATQKLDAKYNYGYSNYKFFNDFLADDEIIEDLVSPYKRYSEKTEIILKDQEFMMECRKEVDSDEDFAQEDSSKLLKNMYVRAQKYYRRFQALGFIQK